MQGQDRRFALGVFFDGLGTLLFAALLHLHASMGYRTMLQDIGLLIILLAVIVQWAAALYFAVPAALESWRQR